MNDKIALLINNIGSLEADLEAEIAKNGAALRFTLEQGRVAFESEVIRRHKELKTSLARYILNTRPLVALTAPFIYALIVPLVLLDFTVSIYQAVCFPAYGLVKVRRRDYLVFDRRHLAYLNALEKLNCAYCSYANGIIAFVREVAGRTEQHWCPIKHARRVLAAHPYYGEFVDYGDAEAFRRKLTEAGAKQGSSEQPQPHIETDAP